jgi:putative flippase GtrA
MTFRPAKSGPIYYDAYTDIKSWLPSIALSYKSNSDVLVRGFIWPDDEALESDSFSSRILRKVLEERLRIAIFALNGIAVFCTGLLIQVSLVEYAHQAYISSYVVQTVASVQVNFLLSRYVTWGDRNAGFLPSLVRFNIQQLLITGLGMAAYSGLELLHVNYILANFAVTGILAPASFLASHNWSITPTGSGHQHRRPRWPSRSGPRG